MADILIKSRFLKIAIDCDNIYCYGCEFFDYEEYSEKRHCRLFGRVENNVRHSDCLKSEIPNFLLENDK